MELDSLARLRALKHEARRRARRRRLAAPPGLNREAELVRAPLPDDPPEYETPWWLTPYGKWRFSAEAEAMRRFLDFAPSVSPDGHLLWAGRLQSALTGQRFLVNVSYPPGFPDDAPIVTIAKPRLPEGTPHLLSEQRPCLYRLRRPWEGYDPASTTAATLVSWTALWIHAFDTWRASGSWPGARD